MVMGIIIAFINCFMFVGRGEEKMEFAASVGLLYKGNRVMLIMTSEFEKNPPEKSLELPLYKLGNGFGVALYNKTNGLPTKWDGYDNGQVIVTCMETNFHDKERDQVFYITTTGKYRIKYSLMKKHWD